MSAAPEFSIVVPTFRRRAELERCLAALARLAVDGPRFEVLIVDDGGDASLADAPRAAHARRWELLRRGHGGPAAARNAGARAASGRWLAFTDDDCEPHPDWLAGFAAAFAADPAACLGGATRNGRADGVLAAAHDTLIAYVCGARSGAGPSRFFPSNNLALPRKEFLALGGFDESFPFAAGEDRDLCARWGAAGGALDVAPAARVDHRHAFDLPGFVAMHFRYGRGAYRFRRQQARGAGLRLDPWSYYLRLIATPFARPRPRRAALLATALLLSQVAHTAGFVRERFVRID